MDRREVFFTLIKLSVSSTLFTLFKTPWGPDCVEGLVLIL